jgi:GNAT superfamily N-acetyltransferase
VNSGRSDVTVDLVDWDDPDAAALRAAQRRELDARYGSDDHEPGVAPTAADVPVFVVARDQDGVAVACGGLRPLDPGVLGPHVVEIKRMYAVPAARGTGAAVAVLRELERQAAAAGATRLVLETGTGQPDAQRFYEREGYERVPLFGPYAASTISVCYGRTL